MSSNHLETPSAGEPCVMVIFGATGDLTKRKLIPALLNLAQEGILAKEFAIVGFAANDLDTESFRKTLGQEMPNFAPDPIDSEDVGGIGAAHLFRQRRFQRSGGVPEAECPDCRGRQGAPYRWQQILLPCRSTALFCAHRRSTGRRGPDERGRRPLDPGDHRKTVWPRSGIRHGNLT